MGSLQRQTIVSEALQLAGNTGLSVRGVVWLQNWLNKTYASHPWPFLTPRYGPFTLAQGQTSFEFGDSAAGIASSVTDKIFSVKRVLLGDTVNSGLKIEPELQSPNELDAKEDPLWNDPNSGGTPMRFLAEIAHSNGYNAAWRWLISPTTVPDKAYRVIIVAQRLPPDMVNDSDIPLYPNDETMVQAVYVQALRHQQDERWVAEAAVLKNMLAEDRALYGKASRYSSKIELNHKNFPKPPGIGGNNQGNFF